MSELDSLREKLHRISRDVEAAVDESLALRRQNPETKEEVIHLWEEFLGHLFRYLKARSKESKDNILAGVSWGRMKLF
ncbi:hypothetical protein [Acetonema longum]|uniref:Uncharacterized protein n=1 Tax=Acetonema longum DSM 6540 TaxID=1009370 RepID=F7NJV7_9FIRM|nr:hypothetical protein [Acetonema longum]EGO63689.1 hypothetical protein ALO_11834 [Acetonema longum DSM 6540]